MTGAGLGKDVNGVDNVRLEAERDLVQCWWEDIVEPLYVNLNFFRRRRR